MEPKYSRGGCFGLAIASKRLHCIVSRFQCQTPIFEQTSFAMASMKKPWTALEKEKILSRRGGKRTTRYFSSPTIVHQQTGSFQTRTLKLGPRTVWRWTIAKLFCGQSDPEIFILLSKDVGKWHFTFLNQLSCMTGSDGNSSGIVSNYGQNQIQTSTGTWPFNSLWYMLLSFPSLMSFLNRDPQGSASLPIMWKLMTCLTAWGRTGSIPTEWVWEHSNAVHFL